MGIVELWVPILVSSVIVFVMSALVWTVLPWHKTDFARTGNEEAVRDALKGATPGAYMLPYVLDPAELKNETVAKKFIDGPQGYVTIVPNGLPKMGGKLMLSFVYNLIVGVFCAYALIHALTPSAPYLEVFRIVGTVAFVAYGFGYIQESIWFGRPWAMTAKSFLDAFLYSMLTAGVFGWLY